MQFYSRAYKMTQALVVTCCNFLRYDWPSKCVYSPLRTISIDHLFCHVMIYANHHTHTYMIPVRGSLPPPPPWYGPKTCVLQHSAWKRVICSVFCTVGGWRGPQTCKFVGFLQPAFRKRVICNVSASTSWSSAVAPPSMSSCHIILNRLI